LRRRPSTELLDETDVPTKEAEASLHDIEWVHARLGGRRMVRRRLGPLLAELGPGPLTVLDVGCGSGHVVRDVENLGAACWAADLKVAHVRLARRGRALAGNAFRLPLASRGVDVVFSTLFLHHFAPEELELLLAESARVARRAVVAFDLTRSAVALGIISALGPLAFESRLSVADGRASVLQAYTLLEARAIAARVLPGASVARVGPFAWQLVWKRG